MISLVMAAETGLQPNGIQFHYFGLIQRTDQMNESIFYRGKRL